MNPMRRLIYLLLLVSFVGISATCVNASTDCERWYVAYRHELAHTRSLQRIAAAKRRAKLYAQRKLATKVPPPKSKPHVVLAKGPRMNRKQTLHHFDLACGILPEEESDTTLISEETLGPYQPEHSLNDGIDLVPAELDNVIAENDNPPAPMGYSNYTPGGPPMSYPPFTNGPPPRGVIGTQSINPGNPNPPSNPPPDNPPPVPEPASYVLMFTGLAGAAGAVRRRINK